MEQKQRTGYPSIDKPWLKYYSEEAINAPLPERTIYEYLYENNKAHLDDGALLYFNKKTSFGQLFDRIAEAAKAYRRVGVRKGDIVTLCTVTTPETIYSMYALNQLGAVSNMIDPRTSEEGIIHDLMETQSRVLLVIGAALPKITKLLDSTKVETVIAISPADSMPLAMKLGYAVAEGRKEPKLPADSRYIAWAAFTKAARDDATVIPEKYEKDRGAVIVHTGGTTGMPKGAVLSNDNINAMVVLQRYAGCRMERGDKFLDIMPPFIAYGLACGITNPLNLGLQIIIIPKFNPSEFDKLIIRYKPQHTIGVPSFWEELTKSKYMENADLSFFKNGITGGDKIAPETEAIINTFLAQHHFHYRLMKGYGMTELSSCATCPVCDECNLPGSVGVPLFSNNTKIVEPGTQNELPYNEMGEICITSPTMILGYYGNEKATQETFVLHADGLRWVHTQDIGYMNEDGVLFVVDRIKRMFARTDGFKVYPSIIESIIMRSPYVTACAVIGAQEADFSQGLVPKAFVVLRDNCEKSEAEICEALQALCRSELSEYALPCSYAVLSSLPLTPIGKVDYRALEQIDLDKQTGGQA